MKITSSLSVPVVANTPPAPSVVQQDLPLVGVGAVVLAATGFLFKWFFDQTVKAWEKRIAELEQEAESARKTYPQLEQLTKATEQLTRQVEQLTEANRQLVALAERMNTYDQRLQNYGGALQDLQRLYNDSQKTYLELKGSLSIEYLRREDWLRFSNILETKLDENNRRFEDLKEIFAGRLKGE